MEKIHIYITFVYTSKSRLFMFHCSKRGQNVLCLQVKEIVDFRNRMRMKMKMKRQFVGRDPLFDIQNNGK